jgi:pimeloyl-ACP methyl ester carboxylesterase
VAAATPGSFAAMPGSPATDGTDDHLRPMSPTGRVTTPDGVAVAYYDLGGEGPPLLLAHATGFCGAVLQPLAARLRGHFRCVVFDERAHGASDRPPDGNFDWHGFATDVLAVVDELGLEHARGFGHSAGGAALLLAEEARPETFAALYCYEPVVFPADTPLPPMLEGNPMAAGALRRRSTFASRRQALANFSSKAPFDRLAPEVLAAYVDNGFAPSEDGIRLRCRREDEAQVYAHGASHDAFSRLAGIACPVTLAYGEETDAMDADLVTAVATRLTAPSGAAVAPEGPVVFPGLGHFGPLEDPPAVAVSVIGALVRGGDTPDA